MPRQQLHIAEIVNIVRVDEIPAVLERFNPTSPVCPQCDAPRQIRNGIPVIPKKICNDDCLKKIITELLNTTNIIELIAAIYAEKHKLANGQTIHYLNDDYRNNSLLFWDSKNKRIVYPFREIDDYGSVPPIFPVGDRYSNPIDWLDQVDHNTFVFPSGSLIREMKEFIIENPGHRKMIVTINDIDYDVIYDEKQMVDKWDSCILEVEPVRSHALFYGSNSKNLNGNDRLVVHPGDPKWRNHIVEPTSEETLSILEKEVRRLKEELNAANAKLQEIRSFAMNV